MNVIIKGSNTLELNITKNCIYDLIWLSKHEIACGGGNKIVNILDANTFAVKSILKGHTESVKSITCLRGNTSIIASGARDGAILIYDLRYNKKSTDESYHSINTINAAHMNAGVATPTPKSRSNNSNTNISPIASVLFQNENLIISTGATDNQIKVWDLRKTYSNRVTNPLPLVSFKNDVSTKGYSNMVISGCRLFANCMNNTIYEYDLASYKCTGGHYNLHKNSSNFVKSCLSVDENFLLTGSSDSNAYIYPINYKNCANVLKLDGAHQNEVTCVAWSPHDSNQLITCSDDNSIRVWNVKYDLSSIQQQENLCKVVQIEDENKRNVLNSNDNIKLFNQKPYYNQQFAMTSVYNDFIFTNYQTKFDMRLRRTFFSDVDESYKIEKRKFLSPTSNLPSNLVIKEKESTTFCVTPKQVSSLVQSRIPFRSNENTPVQPKQQQLSTSTAKKRPLDKIFNEMLNINQQINEDDALTSTPPPSSKRRLLLDSPSNSSNQIGKSAQAAKSMTILDYFSPKSAKK